MTRQYLAKLDNGHVRSVKNFPQGKNWASNQRWEIAQLNRAAGAGRKPRGYWQQNAILIRSHHMKTLAAGGARAALKGVWIGAAIEAPIAATEEFISFRLGQKSRKQALTSSGTKIGVAAVGGGVGGAVAFGVCAAGGSVILSTAAPAIGAVAAMHYGKRLMNLRRNISSLRTGSSPAVNPTAESGTQPDTGTEPVDAIANLLEAGSDSNRSCASADCESARTSRRAQS